ncbi:diguanylate cyclase [Roseovarius gahaiensis]|uniref:diguanylate cyclase n=1 Tax=Roseovarius gahaiensis TaxID=2716691 RepID=A0A967EGG1_9RHOB|nr:sensor domain-containing diguanylate cyclase [Roseovarius gahaiensis]NHQ74585.1 diguanylate cyclase [Roseovarius gahaiensis]
MTSQYLISILNLAGLMALIAVAFYGAFKLTLHSIVQQITFGLILGGGAIFVSLQPIMHVSGVQNDPRNIFVGISAAIFGPWAGLVTFLIAAVTRYYEAAPSANVCVFSLFVAGCAGLVWRHYTRNLVRKRQVHFIILGLTISLSYLSTFLLPRDHWLDIFTTAVPILILTNVIGAMILGGLLERHHNQEERERELLNHAFLDPLTGAMNRRAFEKEYETSILSQTSSCIAFIIIDLDDFKNVNDTYGHTVGDKVLVGVCKILQRSIRDGDLSARFGGDEFVLCLPDISVGDVAPILDRIRRSVSKFGKEEFDLDLNLTVSIGVSWRRKPQRLRAAFESADKSLYQAKANGKNQSMSDDRTIVARDVVNDV